MAISAPLQRRIVLLLAAATLACAPVPRMGETVHIAEESAIIIWDAATKTQHFIRRASFETKAKDFGFLVPTPSVPKLEEADDEAFKFLTALTAPRVREIPPDAKVEAPKGAPPVAPAVVVIATAKVAGYDAVVLEASDANALDLWLKERDYASSPQLVEWYKPYIAQKWKITAFKIDKDNAGAGRVNTTAVRMSFRTDRPFFPYREPAGFDQKLAKPDPRMLRIFFLADARFEARIGTDGAWSGKPAWSDRVSVNDLGQLMKLLKLPKTTAGTIVHLTEFEDASSPRPGHDDLFFGVASDQSTVQRPDIYLSNRAASYSKELADLFWIVVTVGGIGLFIWMAKRRKDA